MFSLFLSSCNRLFRVKTSKLTGPKMLKWENRRKSDQLLINWGLEIPFLLNWSSLVIFLFFFFRVHTACCPYLISCVLSQAYQRFNLALLTGDNKLHDVDVLSQAYQQFSLVLLTGDNKPHGVDDPPLLYICRYELLGGKLQHIAHLLCMYSLHSHSQRVQFLRYFWGKMYLFSVKLLVSGSPRCQWQACHWFGKVVSDCCGAGLELKMLYWSRSHHSCP